jgi:hypothetical protein
MSFKEKINESIEEKIYESLFNLQEKKKLDPVGKADADIDNDGDVDDSDEYLHNRRKAIKKAMAKEETDLDEANKGATPSRYDMIKMAAKKVEKQNAAKERQAMRDAKSAMRKPGATKGMAEPKMDESKV